jgi:small subunit ribosomal protein S6
LVELSDRVYELLFIADPGLGEPEVESLIEQIQGYVEKDDGRVQNIERWGKKRLAYLVKKQREGYYVLMVIEGSGGLMKEVGRRLRVTDGVLKHQAVRVDEELRKAERLKAKRTAAEEKRRRRPSAAAPESGGAQ